MSGWIKLHRQIQEHWLWNKKPFSRGQAWIDLLIMVNHKSQKTLIGNKLIDVDRGERVTSIRKLCSRWGWSNTKTKTFLKLLENDHMISVKSDSKKTTINIVNYNDYQMQDDTKNDRQTTDKRQTNDTEATQKHTNKNDKNDKNDKNEKKLPPLPPKKINYAEFVKLTEAEYNRLVKQYGQDATDTMIEILDNYKGSTGKKYKDDNRAIRSWVVKRYEDDKAKGYLRKNKDEPEAWDTIREWLAEKEAGEKHYDL